MHKVFIITLHYLLDVLQPRIFQSRFDNSNRNATKRFSVPEHLENSRECAKKYHLSRFKITHKMCT